MSATTPWTYDVMKQRAMALTALFETSTSAPACFGVSAGNFDGAGMSFGAIQFNLKTGNLQPIFIHMIDNYPDVTKSAFNYSTDPSYYNTFVDMMKNKTKDEQIAWADTISVTTNKHNLVSPWKAYLSTLGQTQQCIDKQVASAEWYWNTAYNLYQEYKVLSPAPTMFSRRAYALFFDIAVQNGGISTTVKDLITQDFNAIVTTGKTAEQIETEKMVIIANRRADAVTSSFQSTVRERKLAIANGTGYVYGGSLYMDTAVYEMTMEEAFPAPLSQQNAGYFQYYTATGRTQDADTAIGTTISSANYPVNFATMKSANAEYVYIKATSGIAVKDTQFTSANVASARTAGLKVGFYHSANPSNTAHNGQGKTVQGATNEANWFCDKVIETVGSGDSGDIFPALVWIDNSAVWDNSDQAYDWIEAFNNVVKSRFNRTVVMQTGYYYVDGNITAKGKLIHSAKGGVGKIVPLWLTANAPDLVSTTYPNYNFTTFGTFPNDDWAIWQFTTSGTSATYGTTGTNVILNFMENMNDNTVPNAPTGLIATAGDTKVSLAWTVSPHVKVIGYNMYRDGVKVGYADGHNTATYEDTGLNNNVAYSYTVSAVTAWQESVKSSAVSATPVQPIVSLFPYFGHKRRDEEVVSNWTFDNDVTIKGKKALTTGDIGTDTADKLVTRSYVDGTGNAITANLNTHKTDTTNPHSTTKAQVGLGNVDNTSDLNKPVSTATQTALNGKSDTTHNHAGIYEPVIATKKTAFNVDFGTVAGTASQGNHTHDTTYAKLASNSDITGTYSMENGIYVFSKNIANNANAGSVYLRLARVKFTSTYNRILFDMQLVHTGTYMRSGLLKAFLYNADTLNSLHSSSAVIARNNNSMNMDFVAGEIVYMPIDGTTVYYVDIFLKVQDYAKVYANLNFAMYENGAVLSINPDANATITALPTAGTVLNIGGVNCTYGTAVNATIKTVTTA